jgi:hypothetical protein
MQGISKGHGPIARSTKAAVKALTTSRMQRSAARVLLRRAASAAPPPPDEAFMSELRRRFKPQVLELSDYLDRDLVSLWGYEELD